MIWQASGSEASEIQGQGRPVLLVAVAAEGGEEAEQQIFMQVRQKHRHYT